MSPTTMVATQFRLQEWAAQIKECQERPEGMSIAEWCSCNGITKANYYYRLRCVRKACLESLPQEIQQQVIEVTPAMLQSEQGHEKTAVHSEGLEIFLNGFSIHVTESTSMHLLSKVLGVIRHAE